MTQDVFGLRGKKAVIVGGGLGMGESTAMRLAEAGCDVGIVDLDSARAERVAAAVAERGVRSATFTADVLDTDRMGELFADVDDRLGGVDVMVTIVGESDHGPMIELTPEMWDRDHRRNLRYFVFCAQAAVRLMVRRKAGGAITAISSVSGLQSAPHQCAYGAAKAGLISLVKSMSVELAEEGIRVNSIAPGVIRTPRLSQNADAVARQERVIDRIPFRRLGETDEIAKAALFLSSDLASYVTGQTLVVDGGFTA